MDGSNNLGPCPVCDDSGQHGYERIYIKGSD